MRVCYYETDFGHQGRLSDGRLFIAYTTGAAAQGHGAVDRIIAVLHLFDADGNHLSTNVQLGGYCQQRETYRVDRDRAGAAAWIYLDAILQQLAPFQPEYCPIDIRLFDAVIDGVEFGFFYDSGNEDDELHEAVIHLPRDHWYRPPWDTGDDDT